MQTFHKVLATVLQEGQQAEGESVVIGKGKQVEPGKVLEYVEVVRFGVEMLLELGMPQEAQELFN